MIDPQQKCRLSMEKNVFDRVARDYESIHNRRLPPGVRSDEFIAQRAAHVIQWASDRYNGEEFFFLDFGCGNGRMLKSLIESSAISPLLERGHLKLFGFDTSVESIKEAQNLLGDERVYLVSEINQLRGKLYFDFVISCHVFHHIPPDQRGTAATTLRECMKPNGRLVIWEHNPYNPFARLLVNACPFDKDARLLTLDATKRLFENHSFRVVGQAYVDVFPPRWLQFPFLAAIEKRLMSHPFGAQYWIMFATHE
jgi:SAM-dependent methyltransferase